MRDARAQCRWTAILIVWTLAAAGFAQTPATPPNIVLVMADDQGWGDVGFRGHDILQTPVLDEMAASGLRFDRFYSAAPVCSPTRASVLTGRHPNRMGCFQWGHTLRTDEVTIAEVLQKAGYATGHFGKWHLGSIRADSAVCPGQNGFDEWYSASNFYGNSPFFSHNGKAVQTKGEGSHVTVQLALEWMKKVKTGPFCSVIWFGSPHNPHVGTEKYLSMYKGQPKGMAHFYAEITAMDTAIGELRAGLKKLGVASHTVLWFCSDNGGLKPNSMGGLSGRKGKLLEGGIRVPMIVRGPGIRSGSRCDVNVVGYDFLPTFVDLAGGSIAKLRDIDGASITPLLKGKENPILAKRYLHFHYPHHRNTAPHSVVLQGDLKYFRFYEQPGSHYLYNLKYAIGETENIAGQNKATVARLSKEMERYHTAVKACLPKPNPDAPADYQPYDPDKSWD